MSYLVGTTVVIEGSAVVSLEFHPLKFLSSSSAGK